MTAASGSYEQTLKSEIAKQGAPTLFQINGPVDYQKCKNYCRDLSETQLYSWLLEPDMAVKDGDGVYGIPYVVEGYGIIYNENIIQKYFSLPFRKTDFASMDEVNNFSKLKALVEDMSEHLGELGIEGVFASTSFSEGEDWRWHTHLPNLPVYYEFSEKGIADEEQLDFSYEENFKNIFDLYIDNSCTAREDLATKTVDDSMEEFASEADQQASIDFLEWLYGSEEGKKYVTESLGFISPFNTFAYEESPNDPLARQVVSDMSDSAQKSVNWDFTAFPSQRFKVELGNSLHAYCEGEVTYPYLIW